jgi:hypothetical protein
VAEVVVKRGTDANRRGVTFAQGELAYTTDDKNLWVGDGATAGGIPAGKPNVCVTMYNTAEQDINASATDNLVEFNLHSPAIGVATSGTAEDITHSTSSNKHLITINVAGTYEMSANVSVDATGSTPTRWNGKLRFVKTTSSTATEIGGLGNGGYIREASGQDETALSIPSFAFTFAAADTLHLKVDRESSTSAAVDTIARCSTLYIKRLA